MATRMVPVTSCEVCGKDKAVASAEFKQERLLPKADKTERIDWSGDICDACWKRAAKFFERGTTPPGRTAAP